MAVRQVQFDVAHEPRRQYLRIGDHVTVRIRDRHRGDEVVTCVVPGHHQPGGELVAAELTVDDGPLSFAYTDCCGFGAAFAYAG